MLPPKNSYEASTNNSDAHENRVPLFQSPVTSDVHTCPEATDARATVLEVAETASGVTVDATIEIKTATKPKIIEDAHTDLGKAHA